MLHHAVGHREVGRGVVELDVTGERGVPGEHDRRGEDREDSDPDARRPTPGPGPPGPCEQEPDDRERDDQRAGELGGRVSQRRKLAREDDDGQPDGQHERPGQPLAGGDLSEPSAAEREPRQQQRVGNPGDG